MQLVTVTREERSGEVIQKKTLSNNGIFDLSWEKQEKRFANRAKWSIICV